MAPDLTDRQLRRVAAGALVAARFRLWFGSFDRIRREWEAQEGTNGDAGLVAESGRVAGAVDAMSVRIPFARNCLVKASATMTLLRRFGLPGELKIGVAREDGRGFEAHAWVECDGRTLIGGEERKRFTPLREGGAESKTPAN